MICESLLASINKGRLGLNQGIPIGLEKLESVIDGLTQSTYTLLFAGTGSGKSSLALYAYVYKPVMEHLEDDKLEIIYFSLEMSANFIFAKLLSMYIFDTYGVQLSTKELYSKKKGYTLPEKYYDLVLESMKWLHKVEKVVRIYDKGLTADKFYVLMLKKLEQLGSVEKTDTRKIYTPHNSDKTVEIVVDHLGLVRPTSGRKLKEEMDLLSAYCVTLRDTYGVSPLIIMQPNRDSTSMDRRKQGMINFRLSDTKDTGNPPQDCNVALSILNPNRERLNTYNKYDISILGDTFRSITVLKNREGISDVEIGCNFFGRIGIWKELDKPENINDWEKYTNPMYIKNKDNQITKEDENVKLNNLSIKV